MCAHARYARGCTPARRSDPESVDYLGESGGSFAILGSRMSTATTPSGASAASEFSFAIAAARPNAHIVEAPQCAAPDSLTKAAATPDAAVAMASSSRWPP
jgi:hypothetical protein